MNKFNPEDLKKLYIPSPSSHKGQNGKLAIIGGSHLFHGASLWALKVASRIVDMVFYSSVKENNEIAQRLKNKLYDLIVIPRERVDDYLKEADAILIGPGLPREEGRTGVEESTRGLVERLLKKFSHKKWVIDGGALTEIDPEWLKQLNGNVILTPHQGEFERLFHNVILERSSAMQNEAIESSIKQEILSRSLLPQEDLLLRSGALQDDVVKMAKEYNSTILLKGLKDVICSLNECVAIEGGNAGMTKGGTGDVLAGLVAALACKNDLFLAAKAGSFINKKAGEELFKKVGYYFNASDLANEIPRVMKYYISES
ncbi:MAG: ADP/ATP-dependent (S)-NAD(P)H-hydrate dehydratase [Candidatus Levybacteria bacterium]|nr:ADP/ATP-dependent (S)-NAD(P)H-hydrate dehydratase [Candidatus Levybacteria bacterium]